MKSTYNFSFVLALVLFTYQSSLKAGDAVDPAEMSKTLAEAAKTNAEANKTNMNAPAENEKLKAETAKLIAEAYRTISEANLNEAKRQLIFVEIERLRQRMHITDYEFNRVVAADYQMNQEIAYVQGQTNLIRPLILGHANWKTWIGLETLMNRVGDADIIMAVMFDIKVEPLPGTEFIANEFGGFTDAFSGGNLGELYTFAQRNNYSFRKFGTAHKNIMKVVAMISKASDVRIRELRDINQAIRLTIAKIE